MTRVPVAARAGHARRGGGSNRPLLAAVVQPCAVLVITGVAALVLGLSAPVAVRVAAAVFLFAAPGLAWTPVLGLDRGMLETTTAVVLISLTVDVLTAQLCVALAGLSWGLCAAGIVGVVVIGAATRLGAVQLRRPELIARHAVSTP